MKGASWEAPDILPPSKILNIRKKRFEEAEDALLKWLDDLERNEICGLMDAMKVLDNVKGISFVELTEKDVVRHRLVKDIIKAYNKESNNEK